MKEDIQHTFKMIYDKESDSIFRFCLIRVSDREQALDITQEAFLRLWQNMINGQKIHNIRAFVFTTTHHLIIDWYRKKKSIPFRDMKDEDYNGGEEQDYDPSDNLTIDDALLGVEGRYFIEKINELNKANKEPVYLRFVEDLSPVEIGKILGISANAASVRINRGIMELRQKAKFNNEKDK